MERPNGIDGRKSPQQQQHTSPSKRNSDPAAGKPGYSNNVTFGKAQQQQQTTSHKTSLKPLITEKSSTSNTDKGGKAQQKTQKTSTYKPFKTRMSGNPNIGKEERKSGNSNSGKDRQPNQKQNAASNTLTSTFKPRTVEKTGNSSTNVGQSQQQ